MFETFRSIRIQLLLLSVGYLALGTAMLLMPDFFLTVVCYVVGALLIAYGVINIIGCIRKHMMQVFIIMASVVVMGVGVFVITRPRAIISILPIIFGIILLLDGVLNIRHGIGLRRFGAPGSITVMILGLITVIFGAVILFHPYTTAKMTFRLIGVGLVYSGLSDFIVLYRMNHASKVFDQRNTATKRKNNVIDVESHPVDKEE
ncbi:MAG: DUF308 domain-containing protein [Eubacteriales bacterium]|nr:DUF308 domain-containing protein [Eubacteriales bacterium]